MRFSLLVIHITIDKIIECQKAEAQRKQVSEDTTPEYSILEQENKKYQRSVQDEAISGQSQVQGHTDGQHTVLMELALCGYSSFIDHWSPLNLGRWS